VLLLYAQYPHIIFTCDVDVFLLSFVV